MNEGTEKSGKQERIESSIATLQKAINRLSDFVDKVEHNKSNIVPLKGEIEAQRAPLASFLENLPEIIIMQCKRIDEIIVRIKSLLY